jgi:hypothetical protein
VGGASAGGMVSGDMVSVSGTKSGRERRLLWGGDLGKTSSQRRDGGTKRRWQAATHMNFNEGFLGVGALHAAACSPRRKRSWGHGQETDWSESDWNDSETKEVEEEHRGFAECRSALESR